MQWHIRPISFIVALVVAFPIAAADEKKDSPATKDKTEPKDKMVAAGTVQGRLCKLDASQKMVCVEVLVAVVQNQRKTQIAELRAADDLVIRTANPPLELDEKGKPKKYTKKELDKLKGPDTKAWGFPADFDSLKVGQTVLVYMSQKKPDKKPGAKKDLLDDNKPVASKIHILADAPK